jgi:FdrA protein
VRPGRVGIVAASGTGAQQLMCLLDAAGVGVSACLGVGGRDLSAAVGGRSTGRPSRRSTPTPAPTSSSWCRSPCPAGRRRGAGARRPPATPVLLALLGEGAADLTSVVEQVVARSAARSRLADVVARRAAGAAAGGLRGLFSGGTLCDEAMASPSPRSARSPPTSRCGPSGRCRPTSRRRHAMVDFGDDRLTAGRPHPMIDPTPAASSGSPGGRRPGVGVVLLDVVLGHGADPDPAASLAPRSGRRARRRPPTARPRVVVSLCGTAGDPQDRERQAPALRDAGASVLLSNAAAARLAVSLVPSRSAEGRDACPACSPPSRPSSPPAPRCSPTP